MAGIGATSPLAAASAKVGSPPSRTFKSDTTLSEIWVRVIRTLAPRRERGKLGQGRVRAAPSAAWMRLIETGRSPGTNSAGTRMTVGAHVVTLAGSCFCPGSAGR
jgi:hypothetical protein